MTSWKLFGTASAAALLAACTASYGQSCASPFTATLGSTPVATTSGVTLDLTGLCDPGPFGTDTLSNVTWYAFVAPATGDYTVSTCNEVNYDSRLAVLTDCNTPASVLACNDDGPTGCFMTGTTTSFASVLCFSATEGTTYYIAVGGYTTTSVGSGSMTISAGDCGGGGGLCSTSTQDCCTENLKPFCSDSACCETVCAFDPFCCETAWDATCAGVALTECASCGGGGGTCSSSTQDCCVAGAEPFCSDSKCCALICAADPFCCDTQWDQLCADAAATQCDSCDNSGLCGASATNDCCVASSDGSPACTDEACCSAVCAADPFCCNTQWDQICADSASFTCKACMQPCEGPEANHFEAEPCGDNTNGGCGDSANPSPTEPVNMGDVISGTFWSSTALRDTDWYSFTLTEGTQVSLNLYTTAPAFALIVGADFPGNGTCSAFVIAQSAATGCPRTATACLPAGDYIAFTAMSVFQDLPCGSDVNNYVMEIAGVPCDAEPPANDECEGAIVVPAAGGVENFDTTFASTSQPPLDPSCDEGFGLSFVQDVWYSWTPNQSGPVAASTCNTTSLDTRLAVYTDCPAATLVGCNDDAAGCGLTSRLVFEATAGTTYYIRLGGFAAGGTGTVSFTYVVPLSNDECDDAITVADGVTPFDTTTATTSGLALDPSCDEGFGLAFVQDIWFKYVATCSETVTVSTCNDASFDTRLAAYLDCNGSLVACNDDGAGCGLTSSMSFAATQGTTYYLRVGGFSGGGTGNLTISCGSGGGGLTNDDCSTPTVAADGANAFTNVGATSGDPNFSPAECGAFATGFYNDVWFTYTATMSGTATFSTCSSASFDTRLELWLGCPDAGGTLVACNDDGTGCTGFTSLMTADLACDTKYLVRVGAYSTTGFGTGTLTVTPGSTSCGTPCPWDLVVNGIVNGADLGELLVNWGNPGTGDFNNDGTVSGADLGELLVHWGPCP